MKRLLLKKAVFIGALLMGALLLSSCGHIIKDTNAQAHKVGYPTIEIKCDEEISNGVAVCLNPEKIQIQTYFQGELSIDSERCEIHEKITFQNSELIDVIPVYKETSCVINVVMTVLYNEKTRIVSTGYIYLKKSAHEVVTKATKVPEGARDYISFNSDSKARVVVTGCGTVFDKPLEPINGRIAIWSDLFGKDLAQCVYESAIFTAPVLRGSAFFIYYKTKDQNGLSFKPLSEPSVQFKDKKIVVTAEESVGIIEFNGKTVLKNTATFDKSNGIIRVLTTSGRTAIGIVQNENIVWKR